jgi:hypothetical protein
MYEKNYVLQVLVCKICKHYLSKHNFTSHNEVRTITVAQLRKREIFILFDIVCYIRFETAMLLLYFPKPDTFNSLLITTAVFM